MEDDLESEIIELDKSKDTGKHHLKHFQSRRRDNLENIKK